MEREALTLDNLALAMAAKNSNGFVIAQVERVCAPGALNPRQVQIPGVMVDCVVVAQPENHHQTYATVYSPAFSGELQGAARHRWRRCRSTSARSSRAAAPSSCRWAAW